MDTAQELSVTAADQISLLIEKMQVRGGYGAPSKSESAELRKLLDEVILRPLFEKAVKAAGEQ